MRALRADERPNVYGFSARELEEIRVADYLIDHPTASPGKARRKTKAGGWLIIRYATELKRWRTAHGYTQRQAAEALGCVYSTYAQWEQCRNGPPLRVIEQLKKEGYLGGQA